MLGELCLLPIQHWLIMSSDWRQSWLPHDNQTSSLVISTAWWQRTCERTRLCLTLARDNCVLCHRNHLGSILSKLMWQTEGGNKKNAAVNNSWQTFNKNAWKKQTFPCMEAACNHVGSQINMLHCTVCECLGTGRRLDSSHTKQTAVCDKQRLPLLLICYFSSVWSLAGLSCWTHSPNSTVNINN